MSIIVTIGGIDKTKWIAWESLKIDNILTTQVDKCSFKIRNYGSHLYTPRVGAEVIITDAGVKVFAGYIVRRDQTAESYKVLEYICECVDYTRLLQKKLVTETYENMTVAAIITAMVAKYAPYGIDASTNVVCPKVLTSITFNFETIQQCLQRLAEISGYDWYIDYDKNLIFKESSTLVAPFTLTDSNGNYVFNSLRLRRDNSQIRNTIIVRGGYYFGDRRRDKILANGTDYQFPLPYKYRDFSASLTGEPLSIGIDFSSDPENYDALWNYSEKVLRFKETDIPSAGATLSFEGEPLIPVIVKVKSPLAISAMYSAEGVAGDYEFSIQDKNLNSKEEARDRATAELLAYAESLEEGEFITEVSGLKAGQKIEINSDAHSINDSFIIRQVTSRMMTPNVMHYRASLISTKTLDMVGLLQKLLLNRSADTGVDVDVILDKITSYFEEITISESVETMATHSQTETLTAEEDLIDQGLDFPVQFVAGAYVPNPVELVLKNSITEASITNYNIYGTRIFGQRFTPASNFNIGKWGIYMGRVGSPGTIDIEVYLASGGFPTGSPLASATYAGNSLSTTRAWIYDFFDDVYELQSGIEYVMTFKATGGNISNYIFTGYRNSNLVSGENLVYYDGATWQNFASYEMIYKLYSADIKRVFCLDGSRLG